MTKLCSVDETLQERQAVRMGEQDSHRGNGRVGLIVQVGAKSRPELRRELVSSCQCHRGPRPYRTTNLTRTKNFCQEPRVIFSENSHEIIVPFFLLIV